MRRVVLAVAVAGCVAEDIARPPDIDTSQVVRFEYADTPGINWGVELDVLLVVDSSPAIAIHRDRLVASYRGFGAALEYRAGILPDLHLGVITADVGGPGCGPAMRAPSAEHRTSLGHS